MHPMVLESLTQQRLQDLRSGISQRPSCEGTETSRSNGQAAAAESDGSVRVGPVGRTQAKMGLWMVETGARMVRHGGGDLSAESAQSLGLAQDRSAQVRSEQDRQTDDRGNSPVAGDHSSTHKAA
jgi:hypothetical protein